MEVIGTILVLLSRGVFLWAVVGLINPVWARLPHRKMSVAVWALSVVLAVAGGSLLPSDDSTEGTAGNPPYEIIGRDRSGNTRCSFDVRLERVPESSIRNIAEEIKRREAQECERTFIVHYLPGMEVGAGGWATSHFTPNLEVRILCQTVEQANSAPPLLDGEVVGRWRRDVLPAGWLTIVRRDDQLIARWDYTDGSNSENSLDESQLPDGRLRLEDQGGNAFGDYYVVETDGRLGLYDEDGQILLMERDSP